MPLHLGALGAVVRTASANLPSIGVVRTQARIALQRCAQAQVRTTPRRLLGDDQLQEWARTGGRDSGLDWREYAAGSASSVALCARAARNRWETGGHTLASRFLDRCYLATGALITLLDSLVDRTSDIEADSPNFLRLYPTMHALGDSMRTLARTALERAHETPDPAHHAMTLAGVVAYYGSHPGTRSRRHVRSSRCFQAKLYAAIWPALSVMGVWRTAKRLRAMIPIEARGNADKKSRKDRHSHLQ